MSVPLALAAFLAAARPAASDIALSYRGVRARLRASAVRVLLPRTLPATFGGPVRSIVVIAADQHGYAVAFSTDRRCAGSLACADLHVAGFPLLALPSDVDAGARRVRLRNGLAARYVPRDCRGASCSEASLSFVRGRTRYEIDAKVRADGLRLLTEIARRLEPL